MNEKELLHIYKELEKNKKIIDSINTDFFFDYVSKLIHIIEGKECVIETQAHNEEVLNKIIDEKQAEIEDLKLKIQT